MRIMALDVGTKRIGVAVTDPLGMLAQPLTVIQRTDDQRAIADLVQLLSELSVDELVIGLPRRTDGTEGPEAKAVRDFGEKVSHQWPGPLVWYDERLTTVGAENLLLQGDLSRAKRKKVIDQVAASLILQGYLEYKESGIGKTTHITNEE